MKRLTFAAVLALALPVSAAATVAMEAQQATRSEAAFSSTPAGTPAHRPLFIVKYVLRPAPPEAPQIDVDDRGTQIVLPGKGFPAAQLGALQSNPNMVVCSGWGCEREP